MEKIADCHLICSEVSGSIAIGEVVVLFILSDVMMTRGRCGSKESLRCLLKNE